MKYFLSILLFVNLTGTYRLFAPIFKISVSNISIVILAFFLLWLFLEGKRVLNLFRNKYFSIVSILILFWPLFTVYYAPDIEPKSIGLQIYYFSLFVGTVLFLKRYGVFSFSKIIAASYWTAVAGLFLSFLFPEFFSSVAFVVEAKTDYYGRAFGFMLQPNMAVTNVTLLFISYMAFYAIRKKSTLLLTVGSYVIAIFLTGARTGIVIMLVIAALHFFYFIKTHTVITNSGRVLLKRLLLPRVVILFGLAAALIVTTTAVLKYIEGSNIIKTQQTGYGLRERIDDFLRGKLSSSGVVADENLQARFDFQIWYLKYIAERPFSGFGLGSKKIMRDTGELPFASHNQYIDYSLEYGIFYTLFFFTFFFIAPAFSHKRKFIESTYGSNWILQTVVTVMLLSMVSNTVLFIRTAWPLLGVIFFFLYFSKPKSLPEPVRFDAVGIRKCV